MIIAICDDDVNHCVVLEKYLMEAGQKFENLRLDIEVYHSGEDLLRSLDQVDNHPQILFLDMEMGPLDGLRTADALRQRDQNMLIIYVTSYDKYTMESFAVSPFRYLLKPISYEEIDKVFSLAVDQVLSNASSLFLQHRHELIQVPCHQIISIVSTKGRMIRINASQELLHREFYGRIKELEQRLNPLIFTKINQGTIVNLNHVHALSGDEVTMQSGDVFYTSRSRRKAVREAYSTFVKRKLGLWQ